MISTRLSTRIEKRDNFAAQRIDRGDVRTLEAITIKAGERKVLRPGFASMLLRDYVVGFVREEGDTSGSRQYSQQPQARFFTDRLSPCGMYAGLTVLLDVMMGSGLD